MRRDSIQHDLRKRDGVIYLTPQMEIKRLSGELPGIDVERLNTIGNTFTSASAANRMCQGIRCRHSIYLSIDGNDSDRQGLYDEDGENWVIVYEPVSMSPQVITVEELGYIPAAPVFSSKWAAELALEELSDTLLINSAYNIYGVLDTSGMSRYLGGNYTECSDCPHQVKDGEKDYRCSAMYGCICEAKNPLS